MTYPRRKFGEKNEREMNKVKEVVKKPFGEDMSSSNFSVKFLGYLTKSKCETRFLSFSGFWREHRGLANTFLAGSTDSCSENLIC